MQPQQDSPSDAIAAERADGTRSLRVGAYALFPDGSQQFVDQERIAARSLLKGLRELRVRRSDRGRRSRDRGRPAQTVAAAR